MNGRYCRQISQIGEEGQLSLKNHSVLVVGAGGIGSPLLLYLAGAGVGKIGLIDFDVIEKSNLHRQILFTEYDIGKHKAREAVRRLRALNSDINVKCYSQKLSIDNATTIFKNFQLVIDGSDNFQTRYLVNDICCQMSLPLLSVSIYQSEIQIITADTRVIPPFLTDIKNRGLSSH